MLKPCFPLIDTANIYGGGTRGTHTERAGTSERMVGAVTKGKRDRFVIASKACWSMEDDVRPNDHGLSRATLTRHLEGSLTRLQTDYIDLYLLHTFDAGTPLEETLGALDDMVRAGKVRYIGCSNFRAWKIVEALWQSDRRNLARFVCIQNQYNLLNRWELEPDLLPTTETPVPEPASNPSPMT